MKREGTGLAASNDIWQEEERGRFDGSLLIAYIVYVCCDAVGRFLL